MEIPLKATALGRFVSTCLIYVLCSFPIDIMKMIKNIKTFE